MSAAMLVATLALVATGKAHAQTPFTQGTSLSAFPSGAANDHASTFSSTSCGSAGSCVSVGYYTDTSGGQQAVVLPITNGTPGTELEVPLPTGAATGSSQIASLASVSCWAAGSCIAVGTYKDSMSHQQTMVVPISGGAPGIASEVLPSSTTGPYLSTVSCWSAGSCVAVGATTSGSNRLPLTVTVSNGTVQPATGVSLPSNAASASTFDELNDVSCTPDGACVAVGNYSYSGSSGNNTDPLVVDYSNGVPGTGQEAGEPSNAATGSSQTGQLLHVACPSAGTCTATGQYTTTPIGQYELFETQITAGKPGAGIGITLPAGGEGGPLGGGAPITGLGCASAGSCVAVGWDATTSGIQALAAPIVNGAGSSTHVTLPSDAGTNNAYLQGVGCTPSGPCLAAGYYNNAASHTEAMIVPISGAGVGSAIAAVAPANESTSSPSAILETIGCGSSGSCAAVGIEENTSGSYQPYVVSVESALNIGTSSLHGGALGVPYQSTLSASGGWGTYSWSVTSGSLPAGLTLNSQTGVISGTPTTPGSSAFTIQASAAGVPTETAAQSLSLAVLAPAVTEAAGILKAKSNRVDVKLACSDAPCTGPVKLEVTEVVTVRHGKKRIHKHRTIVIGSASFSIAAGQTASVAVTLNGKGRKLLEAAKIHRLSVTVLASPSGGNLLTHRTTITETVKSHRKKH
jgi:hypothetical protein